MGIVRVVLNRITLRILANVWKEKMKLWMYVSILWFELTFTFIEWKSSSLFDYLKEKHFSIFHFYILKLKSNMVFCFKKLKMKIEFSEKKIQWPNDTLTYHTKLTTVFRIHLYESDINLLILLLARMRISVFPKMWNYPYNMLEKCYFLI